MKTKSTRSEVYSALESERDYQKARWGVSRSSGEEGSGERTLDEFALYIHGYADELRRIASTTSDPVKKLNFVRKVGELAVACMQQHGAIQRSEEEIEKARVKALEELSSK